MKAIVAAFNQEKALVGAFSVITNLQMDIFEALVFTCSQSDVYMMIHMVMWCESSQKGWSTQSTVMKRTVHLCGCVWGGPGMFNIFVNDSSLFTISYCQLCKRGLSTMRISWFQSQYPICISWGWESAPPWDLSFFWYPDTDCVSPLCVARPSLTSQLRRDLSEHF